MRWLSCVVIALAACGSVSETKMDAKSIDTPEVCVPETDAELCTAAMGCERRDFTDKCGMARNVDCGACTDGKGCVVGTCKTPVCGPTFNYTRAVFPNMSRSGIEDSIGAATPDAQVIVYILTDQNVNICQAYHIIIADEVTLGSGTYTQRDVSSTFNTLGLFVGQDAYAITPDGLTIVTTTTDRKTLKSVKRSAINAVDWGNLSTADFVNINMQTMGNNKQIVSPALSPDGLEFWYSIVEGNTTLPYVSVRTSTTVPFPAGTAAPAPVSSYPLVSAISSDRLALFVFDNFTGRVLTRNSTSAMFTNPNAPAAPPALVNWAHKPLADCSKIIGMGGTAGGCQNEDVIVLTRQ
jgi:hypothetical protein